MRMFYCPNCNGKFGFRRMLGGFSWLLIIVSLIFCLAAPMLLLLWVPGVSCLVLIHPKRCIRCGNTALSAEVQNTVTAIKNDPKNTLVGIAVFAGIAVLVGAIGAVISWVNDSSVQDPKTHLAPIIKGPKYNEVTTKPRKQTPRIEHSPHFDQEPIEPVMPEEIEEPPFDDTVDQCMSMVRQHFPKLTVWAGPAGLEDTSRRLYQQNSKHLFLYFEFDPGMGLQKGSGAATCDVRGLSVVLKSVQLGIIHYDFNDDGSVAQKSAWAGSQEGTPPTN